MLRDVFAYVFLGLSVAFLLFKYYYRPHNPFAFPGFEERLLLLLPAFVITAAASDLAAYWPDFYSWVSGLYIYQRAASSRPVRLAAAAASAAVRRTRRYFDPARRWFFLRAGVAVFAAALVPVLLQQKGVAGGAALFFFLYALLSLIKRLDNRVLAVPTLLLIALCPVLLSFKQEGMAELAAVFAYYCLATTVLLQFADYLRDRENFY
jgi:hypothetical protein